MADLRYDGGVGLSTKTNPYNTPDVAQSPQHSVLINEHMEACFQRYEQLVQMLSRMEDYTEPQSSKDEGPCNPGFLPLLVYQTRELRLRLERLVRMAERY